VTRSPATPYTPLALHAAREHGADLRTVVQSYDQRILETLDDYTFHLHQLFLHATLS
jgi:hypothetical protein